MIDKHYYWSYRNEWGKTKLYENEKLTYRTEVMQESNNPKTATDLILTIMW